MVLLSHPQVCSSHHLSLAVKCSNRGLTFYTNLFGHNLLDSLSKIYSSFLDYSYLWHLLDFHQYQAKASPIKIIGDSRVHKWLRNNIYGSFLNHFIHELVPKYIVTMPSAVAPV